MQNLRIFLEDIPKYLPEKLKELGISETDTGNIYQKVIDKVGGEDNFSDFLMGFLNLLYDNFDMYFFEGFTEPSLLYHISVRGEDLRELIQNFYAGKINIGPKDYYLSKLKGYEKWKVLQVLELYIELGKLVPDVYKRYGEESVLNKREEKIREKYPNTREIKEREIVTELYSKTQRANQYETKVVGKKEGSFTRFIFKLVALVVGGVIVFYIIMKLLGV